MEEINLLQNRQHGGHASLQRQGRIVTTILVVILIALIGIAVAMYLFTRTLNTQISTATTEAQNLKIQVDKRQDGLDGAQVFQAQLVNFKALVKTHVYLTPLLDELAKLTYIHAQYNTFTSDGNGVVHLEGNVDTYTDLGKLLLGLSTSKNFTNVKLLSVAPSTGQRNDYGFAIDITINPSLLQKQ